jgi:hypothetical protein
MEVNENVIQWPKSFEVKVEHFESKELPKEWLQIAYDQKWFKAFVSKRYNGRGSKLTEGLQILFETGSIHPSLGWTVNLGAGANYFSGFFSHPGAKRIFTSDKVVLAGSGSLASKFERVEGGYLASGYWKKATGSAHATAFTMNGKTQSGDIISCTLSPDQVQLHDDWKLFGLKATSSIGYSAKDAFIPDDATFQINQFKNSYRTDVHFLPFELFARFSMSASFLGIAKGFSDQFDLIEYPKEEAKEANRELKNLIQLFYQQLFSVAKETEQIVKDSNPKFQMDNMTKLSGRIGFETFMAVQKVYFHAGLVMADESKVVHHYFKDLMLAAQHSFLK